MYFYFATAWWTWLLLPAHYLMGPVHGAIVNWCGHKYGYRNFDNGDASRNTLIFDSVTCGELFQNNHHKYAMSPNFAARWFECWVGTGGGKSAWMRSETPRYPGSRRAIFWK